MARTRKPTIKLLLVDDHPLVLEGIRSCLEKHDQICIVGEARDGKEALQLARRLAPDIVLLDISMPNLNGFEAAKQLRKVAPGIRIIALTMHDNKEYIREMLQSGVRGYVLKATSLGELVQAIEQVYQGGTFFSHGVSQVLLDQYLAGEGNGPGHRAGRPDLSQREREVLGLITDGLSNKEIGLQLGVSIRTVESHRERIMRKLDIHSIAGLIRYALASGLSR